MIFRNSNKKKKSSEEVDYWLSSTDILASLAMVLLLIMMILMMYIVRIPDEDYVDLYEGDHFEEYDDPDPGAGNRGDHDDGGYEGHYWSTGDDAGANSSGGGGGGATNEEGDEEEEFLEEIEGEGKDKTAVHVMVVDDETNTTIKEKGILFELYSAGGSLQVLSTYYPDKKEYRQYETTQAGTFYLPEKISVGSYELHELTVPKGYDIPENVEFTVTESLDWPEAYTVTVHLSPSKNNICIQLQDSETREFLADGEFEILAAENIRTADGTTRYTKGQIVDRISTDSQGYAESKELYLGKYQVRLAKIPEYYAGLAEDVDVKLEQKTNNIETPVKEIGLTKTSATIILYDELYNNIHLANAAFRITCESAPTAAKTVKTNQDGEIFLTDLLKNAVYHIRQTTAAKGYNLADELTFTVDSTGRIESNISATIPIYNRTLRVSVEVQDRLLRNQVSGTNLTLFDSDGNIVESWNSTGIAKTMTGIEQGEYYILVNGNEKSRVDIIVNDEKEIQEYQVFVFTNMSIAVIVASILFGAAAIVLIIMLLRRIIKKRKKKE